MKIARWINGILALWLAFSAFFGATVVSNIVNLVAVGLIVASAGMVLLEHAKWQGWTAILAGFWLVAAVFIPGLREGSGLVWNSLAVGAVILLASVPLSAGGRDLPPSARWPGEREHEQHEHDEHEHVHH